MVSKEPVLSVMATGEKFEDGAVRQGYLASNLMDDLIKARPSKMKQLQREHAEKKEADSKAMKVLATARRKEKEEKRNLARLVSVDLVLRKRFLYEDGISGLKQLDPQDLERATRFVKRWAFKRTIAYALPIVMSLFGIIGGAQNVWVPLASFASLTVFTYPFLKNLWFLRSGYFLKPYCADCIKKLNYDGCRCLPNSDM